MIWNDEIILKFSKPSKKNCGIFDLRIRGSLTFVNLSDKNVPFGFVRHIGCE